MRFAGFENVVHFVADNASNMVLAGNKLESKFSSIYWSPSAAQCLNLILTDLGKLEIVKEVVEDASKITMYLYSHCNPLFLMRQSLMDMEYFIPDQLALLLILLHYEVYTSKNIFFIAWLYQKSGHGLHAQEKQNHDILLTLY
jgi:hypothetical protein